MLKGESMAAYVISEIAEILDPALLEEYRSLAQAAIEQYGGRYVARGGAIELVEGGPVPQRLVIVEFPTMQTVREWYRSPEYAKALVVRPNAMKRRLLFVEGAFA
jgi:uncharacterized protein (DUF1330 family)